VAWSTDRGPSKTIQRQLSPGNAEGWTWVRALLSDSALALGLRPTGLSKVVREPRAGLYVAKWRMFCYLAWLQISPARFKQVYSDKALWPVPLQQERRFLG